jgi:hypothetical protein
VAAPATPSADQVPAAQMAAMVTDLLTKALAA